MTRKLSAAAIGLACMAIAGTAPADARVRIRQGLTATAAGGGARGVARLVLKTTSDGEFRIEARRLARRTTYAVLVDGTHVGDLTTSGGGTGAARFRTRVRSARDLPLGFDPRGATIVLRNGNGEDVLTVTFPATGSGGGNGGDDGDVVCCIPDDEGGPECEDRTPAECSAQGGTVVPGANSCLPNPCEGAPPVGADPDIVCCIPDDSGPECEDRTQAQCLAQGGTVVAATSCASNPCAGPGVPPGGDEIACCVPSGAEGPECETRTPAQCSAEGGTPAPTGTCAPDPCGGSHGGNDDGSGGGSGRGRR